MGPSYRGVSRMRVIQPLTEFNNYLREHGIRGKIVSFANLNAGDIPEDICAYIATGIPCSERNTEAPSDNDLAPRTPSQHDIGVVVTGFLEKL